MSKNKSVSLFEVLQPSDDKKEKNVEPEVAAQPVVETPKPRKTIVPEPPKPPQPPTFQSESKAGVSETVKKSDLKNVSVREKNDHFVLIVSVLLSFSLVTGLVGFKFGRDKGRIEGAEAVVRARGNKWLGIKPHQQVRPSKSTIQKTSLSSSPAVPVLPREVRSMSKDQKKAVAPPIKRKFTLQVQTFGPGQTKRCDDLIGALRDTGYDAFADYRRGVVFVGRLESIKSKEAEALKNKISRFNWHARSLRPFFANIPDKLKK